MLEALPTGPYYYNVNHKLYDGEELKQGIYQIVVINAPNLQNYFLCDQEEGRLTAARVSNYKMFCTEEEIKYAHSLGYQMFLVDSWISENKIDLFSDYVNTIYKE